MMQEYEILLKYPEFDYEKIKETYKIWEVDDTTTGEGHWIYPDWIFDPAIGFDYLILTYAPSSPLAAVKSLRERKEMALKDAGVPKEQWDKILINANPMVGDMLTRFFREYKDFNYELLISSKEAVETLLEVVRKPIDSRLLDDKERNAVKAKKECFDDAKYLMGEIKKILSELREESEDVAEHVNQSAFKGGLAEKFSKTTKKV